ncbi:ribonuclease H-like protein, partial [Dentipellis sp. KUC8613]
IYTDGACFNNGRVNAHCGAGIWLGHNHPGNKTIRVPGALQSNQVGELVAITEALRATENFVPVTIHTDSQYSIKGLTKFLQEWEDRGWIGVKNSLYFRVAAALLRARTATTKFKWVRGHNGDRGNEEADRTAKLGALKPTPDDINLTIAPNFNLTGAKLATITQSTAYQGIRDRMPLPERRTTNIHLGRAQAALEEFTGHCETQATLWRSSTNTDFPKKIQQFLYKAMHNCYRVGEYWSHIPGYETRAPCQSCTHDTEDLEHILTDTTCTNNVARIIWALAKDLWPHGDNAWPDLSLGIILASGVVGVTDTQIDAPPARQHHDENQLNGGASRLLRILLAESAYLIWVIRCERVIQGRQHAPQEIIQRWLTAIHKRILLDRAMYCYIKRTEKYKTKLLATWSPTLLDPPDNWSTNIEVLVGIK